MKVYEVLREVDALRPNDFSADQKLSWLNEVEAAICLYLRKEYDRADFCWEERKNALELPVPFELVECVYIDGKKVEKSNFMCEGIWGNNKEMGLFGKKKAHITVIYQKEYKPYRVKRKKLSGAAFSQNGITFLSTHPFEVGDMVEINGHNEWGNNQRTLVVGVEEDSVLFGNDTFMAGTALRGEITAMPQDTLKASLPFSKLYVEYLHGKIAYAQRDYEEYNNAMRIFNQTYEEYRTYLKECAPMLIECVPKEESTTTSKRRFHAYW